MSGVITNANSEVPSDDRDEEGPIDLVPQAMLEMHNGKWKAIPVQYMDIFTGEAIPFDRICFILDELHRAQRRLSTGRDRFRQVMMETNDCWQAYAAHVRFMEEVWKRLSDEKIVITICVTAPPAETQDVAAAKQQWLLKEIAQCVWELKGRCQDIWTSSWEIGTGRKTHIYARYPYHLGLQLQELCRKLSTFLHSDTFSAQVVTEARPKLLHNAGKVKSWEPHINGYRLQPPGTYDITPATKMCPAASEESFLKVMTEHLYNLVFQKSVDGEALSDAVYVMKPDWQSIHLPLKAWMLAQRLALKDEMQTMYVYCMISGLVIDAARKGMDQPGPDVFFYTCSATAKTRLMRIYADDLEMFMSTKVGDKIIAFDKPFKLFGEATEGYKLDDEGGIWAVYGFKYDVDGVKGMSIKHAGITMYQDLTPRMHQQQLHSFRFQMKHHFAKIGRFVKLW